MPEQSTEEFDVIVVGAGPTGFVMAIDLGRRGIRTLLIEKDPTTKPWPKMDRSNARSMEIFRRLGIAEEVRAIGYPPEASMDVLIIKSMNEPALTILEYPTVAEHRKVIEQTRDGSEPLEPYQLVAQNDLEPVFKRIAEATPNVTVRFGCGLREFEEDADGITAILETTDGQTSQIRAKYLAGCDGGVSTVRKQLGIKLEGRGGLVEMQQIIFSSPDLYDKIPIGKGRHYYVADEERASFVIQGSRKEITLQMNPKDDIDMRAEIQKRVGFDFDFEVKHSTLWKLHLLLADKYRVGRAFIAGDAAHLVIPTGGLGMNSGIGDAIDLSWKLAGTIQGWGGPGLLDSYEPERRRVGQRIVEASGWAAEGMFLWRSEWRPEIWDDTEEGAAVREKLAKAADQHQRRVHEMIGVELGYTYAGSNLVAYEPNNVPEWDIIKYTPHARPGVRLPHVWLQDGRAIQDVLGSGYVLLDLTGDVDTTAVEKAFAATGAPLEVLHSDEPDARAVYEAPLLLLRPDLHVFWRGDVLPDATELASAATGHRTEPFGLATASVH